ncbi:hypothetical protein BH790_gp67 [Gordonia phage Gsput1]|uniref:Uncharacterized protein n=1 Tax=Gordonia phage Gsput1 TaxID=1622193 RepID=A0A0E3XBQ1_9CAUD|nr:hypothetical protein BH790_gp67 [Gordonia phage Gsput1]AKC03092.1 hypothetical protein Gsput1_67 [Gordonia phage Gsput1]
MNPANIRRIGRVFVCRFTADDMRALYSKLIARRDLHSALVLTGGRVTLIVERKPTHDGS